MLPARRRDRTDFVVEGARTDNSLRMAEPTTGEPLLGVGRAARVFLSHDARGRPTARKVFTSDALTRVVQQIFLGARNPYAWSEDAVQAAILRRRILAPLVRHWFGDRLRVAEGYSVDWNGAHGAWQLHTEYVPGRKPALHHPLDRAGGVAVNELARELLPALQAHLREAGFDGQVWQAGLGNPVALSNFLVEETADGRRAWAWIDLESGVPALFPAHLPSLWRFYLPRAFRYRRPLFDDVDTLALRRWLASRRDELEAALGAPTVEGLERDAAALEYRQEAWRSTCWLERSLRARLARGGITVDQLEHYRTRPVRWYARELGRWSAGAVSKVGRGLARGVARLARLPWRRGARVFAGFLVSQELRHELARRFVRARIGMWVDRGQLSDDHADRLRADLHRQESSTYLADFGMHLAIKPFVKTTEYVISPALFAAGWIDQWTLAAIWASGGSVGRTVYTTFRLVQNFLRGRELPWTALWTGILPVVGNLAFPFQIARSGRADEDVVAQFIVYDGCALLGRRLPIWGGRDTLTEHRFNHLPDRWLLRRR